MHCVILQIDPDFLQVKIFRHVVRRNGIEHRDIADAVEIIQVVFIHRTDANRLICYFFAVCVLDIFVMRKVIPGMGRELCSVRTLFRPVNAAAAAERIVVVSPEVFLNPVLLLKLFGYGIATMYFRAA